MRYINLILFILVMIGVTVAVVDMIGCAHSPTPPNTQTSSMAVCSRDMALPTASDVCDGYYTVEGFACVNCASASGCLDAMDSVYCVTVNCTSDSRCQYSNGNFARRRKK